MFNDICIMIFNLYIYTRIIALKRNNLAEKIIMITGCILMLASYFFTITVANIPPSEAVVFCMTLPSLILFWLLAKYKDARFLLTFCFIDTISYILAFFGRCIGIYLGKIYGTIGMLILLVLIVLFGNKYFKAFSKLLDYEKAGWNLMTAASIFIYVALVFMAAYPVPLIQRNEYIPSYTVFCMVVLLSYCVFINSIIKTKKIHEQNNQLIKEKTFFNMAYKDGLTNVGNRAAYIEKINEMERKIDLYKNICLIMFDLNDMKLINDTYGHLEGDNAIICISKIAEEIFAEENFKTYRIGGDEFVIVSVNNDKNIIESKILEMTDRISDTNNNKKIKLSVAIGYDYYE